MPSDSPNNPTPQAFVSQGFTQTLLDSFDGNAALLSADGTIVAVNRGWRSFADANGLDDANYCVGVNYPQLCRGAKGFSSDGATEVSAAIQSLLDGTENVACHEYPCHSPDEKRWFRMQMKRLDTTPTHLVVFHLNVTDEVLAKEQIRQQEQMLNRLHSELAQSMRLHTMNEMAAGIAHELNQPLGAILNYAGVLAESLHQSPDQENSHAELAERIGDCAEIAGKMIHRLRDFVGRNKQQLSTVSVRSIINEACALLLHELHQQSIDVTVNERDVLPDIVCDRVQIAQVLVNLIRNSIEAMAKTPIDKRKIEITLLRSGTESIEIGVADRGCGLPDSKPVHEFELFASEKALGSGMGLPISHRIVKGHGGRLWGEPRPGAGALFRVELPLKLQ